MIRGVGIDIVSIKRFERALKRWGSKLSERLFTEGELRYCTSKKDPVPHMAARFAAKEAAIKAMGEPMSYKDIEVKRSASGVPSLNLAGLGGDHRLHLSLSHERDFAVAQVIVEI